MGVNQLTGELPQSLKNLTKLQGVWFYENAGLCAPDDSTFQTWLRSVPTVSGPTCRSQTPTLTPTPTPTAIYAPHGCSNGAVVPNPGANPGLVADCVALLASRDTLRGSASLNWSDNVAITQWRGITVSGSPGRVTQVHLAAAGLNGRIPSELGNLDSLDRLFLSVNNLDGTIPSSLGNLSNLSQLGLSSNNLSGNIPRELGSLSRLEYLLLGSNQLSGDIPPELGNLARLARLDIYSNRLSGNVPSSFGNLSALNLISMENNQLTGELPRSMTNLTLDILLFHKNAGLCAPADSAFQTWLQSVNDVRGDKCESQTTRPTPTPTATPTPTPAPYGCSNGVVVPNPGANSGLAMDCAALLAARDTLRGSASLNWSDNTAIQQWRGITVSGSPRRVTRVDLRNSGLNGRLPSELGNLDSLDWLYLSNNNLTGSVPSELGNLSKLTLLGLNYNNLSGSIPRELGNLSRLQDLYLNDNNLSGSIPRELGNLSRLKKLSLEENSLAGNVPSSFGNLSSLENTELHENELTGELPRSMTNLTKLDYLYFDDNAGLCAPADSAFQTWLRGVANVRGDDCESQTATPTPTPTPTATPTPTPTATPAPRLADAAVTNVAVTSRPAGEDTYRLRETIEVTVTFSGTVYVTGVPAVSLGHYFSGGSTNNMSALYASGSGSQRIWSSDT